MAHETNIHNVTSITNTVFRSASLGIQWIELHIVCKDGTELDVKIYPPIGDKAAFERLQRQLQIGEVK